MAAPNIAEDLTDITTAESTTGWSAFGGGAAGLSASPDLAVEGTNCVDKQVTNSDKGAVFNDGSVTLGADDHVFVWVIGSTPGLEDILANNGKYVAIGTATSALVKFHVSGSDVSVPGARTEICYPIRYVNTSSGSAPYRTLVGSPGTAPDEFGGGLNTTAAVKGANLGVDVIRYGTGYYITAGDSGDPILLVDIAANNDGSAKGVFSESYPGGYAQQGKVVIGQTNTGTPTLAYMDDRNATIIFTDTPHSLSDFTEWLFDHGSTEVYLSGVTWVAVGTNNRGRFEVLNSSTVVILTACVWTKTGAIVMEAATQIVGGTIRDTGLVTMNGGLLDGVRVVGGDQVSTDGSLVLCDDLEQIVGCTFVSDGSTAHHAIEIDTAGTYNFDSNAFSGFNASDGQNGSVIHNTSGGLVTINVIGTGGTVSYKNTGGGSSTTVNVTKSLVVTGIVNGSEVTVVNASTGAELFHTESVTGNQVSYAHDGAGTIVNIYIANTGYVWLPVDSVTLDDDVEIPVTQIGDPVYQNP